MTLFLTHLVVYLSWEIRFGVVWGPLISGKFFLCRRQEETEYQVTSPLAFGRVQIEIGFRGQPCHKLPWMWVQSRWWRLHANAVGSLMASQTILALIRPRMSQLSGHCVSSSQLVSFLFYFVLSLVFLLSFWVLRSKPRGLYMLKSWFTTDLCSQPPTIVNGSSNLPGCFFIVEYWSCYRVLLLQMIPSGNRPDEISENSPCVSKECFQSSLMFQKKSKIRYL